jgi:hypothetical protein
MVDSTAQTGRGGPEDYFGYGPILLQKSKIEQPKEARES